MNQATVSDHSQRILRVLIHIQRNLDEEHTLDSLAGVACFSPFHFHRVFAAYVGESVMAHIRRLRLEKAALKLQRSKESVIRVALDTGYETHEAFTRAFKSAMGMSPSSFRKQARAGFGHSPSGVHYSDDGRALAFEPLTHRGDGMEVKIEEWKAREVAFVRHIGPYNQCGKAWEKLCTWAGPLGLLATEPWFAGISYDDPSITAPEKLRYDACIGVPADVQARGEVGRQTIPAGKYAVVLHEGPYDNFNDTYNFLYSTWLPSSGWELRDAPCVEIYLNDPDGTAPEDLLTHVCIPVESS